MARPPSRQKPPPMSLVLEHDEDFAPSPPHHHARTPLGAAGGLLGGRPGSGAWDPAGMMIMEMDSESDSGDDM